VKGLSRRLAVLFALSILGVALVVGIVVGSLTGLPGVVAYAAVATLVLVLAIARGRRLVKPQPLPPGRSCTCCTTKQTDPVKVI
jgi:hypothetical protein